MVDGWGSRERRPLAISSAHDVKEPPATAERAQGTVRAAEAARLGVGREFDFACGFGYEARLRAPLVTRRWHPNLPESSENSGLALDANAKCLPVSARSELPAWVAEQAALQRGQPGYERKPALICRRAKELVVNGERPTHERIREMLRALDRNYRVSATEIAMALRPLHKSGAVERFSNGHRVEVDSHVYPSIRAAAKAEGCAIETVRKRIRAGRPGWRYVD